jgi:transposase InsO family protein
MRLHRNAALSWSGRRLLVERVEQGWAVTAAAEAAGVSVRCTRKWIGRYRAEGEAGLYDRSSAPRRVANRTPDDRVVAILALRRLRMTAAEIAETLSMPLSTVSVVLRRSGLGRLGRVGLEPRPATNARGRASSCTSMSRARSDQGRRWLARPRWAQALQRNFHRPGRQTPQHVGYEYVHIAVDDYSRLAYAEVLMDERASTAAGFLARAAVHFRRYGITVERVLTDNGSAYRGAVHAVACRKLGIRHLRTRPYRPQTNGKAERFIRTLLEGWAYGAIYRSSQERTRALDGWLWHYNHRRRHSALGHQPPVTEPTCLVHTRSGLSACGAASAASALAAGATAARVRAVRVISTIARRLEHDVQDDDRDVHADAEREQRAPAGLALKQIEQEALLGAGAAGRDRQQRRQALRDLDESARCGSSPAGGTRAA